VTSPPLPLSGKVALVTGASRGIGLAIARALAKEGAALAILSTRLDGAAPVADALRAAGTKAHAVAADVASPKALDAALAEVKRALGPVDILVNNAGVALRRPLAETEDADFERVVAVNLAGPFYLARRLLPAMAARGWGRLINVSSISGTLGTAGMTAYCASKWGLNGLTRALAEEVRGRGVLVAAVLPGSTDTEMLTGSDFVAKMGPEEVAKVVRFLCAEAPLAMSGSLLEVFG
jgi:NAD(P)-dependent dehydrogenase (short-subunit alcohol dehydrogenase family)